jgi:hypothetical protein
MDMMQEGNRDISGHRIIDENRYRNMNIRGYNSMPAFNVAFFPSFLPFFLS